MQFVFQSLIHFAQRRRLTRERLGALLFLGLTLIYGSQIPHIQELPVDALEAMNARTLPWVLFTGGVVGALLLWLLNPAPRTEAETAIKPKSGAIMERGSNLLVAGMLLLWTVVFSWLLGILGFGPAVGLFLLGGFWLLGERRVRIALLTALVTALLLTLILQLGFGLYLPSGTLWAASTFSGISNV